MVPAKIARRIQSRVFSNISAQPGAFSVSTGKVPAGRVWLIIDFQGEVSTGPPDFISSGVFICPPGAPDPLFPNGVNSTPAPRAMGGVFQISGGGIAIGGRSYFSPGVMTTTVPQGTNPSLPFWLNEDWELQFQIAGSPANMVQGIQGVLSILYVELKNEELCKL